MPQPDDSLPSGAAAGPSTSPPIVPAPPLAPVRTTPPSTAPTAKQCRPGDLSAELRVGILRSARRLRAERGAADLPDHLFTVLALLNASGPMTPGALAEAQHVQPPSMTRSVNALVEMGLVGKSEHPTDGRQVVVTVTEAGATEVNETRRRRDAWLTKKLAAMTPAERATLAEAAELLRRIAAE